MGRRLLTAHQKSFGEVHWEEVELLGVHDLVEEKCPQGICPVK